MLAVAAVVSLVTAVLVLIASLLVVPMIVDARLRAAINGATILESADASGFAGWKDGKDEFASYYLFNVTNPDEFIAGGMPRLNEVGPFVYQVRMNRTDVTWDREADTMSWYQQNFWVFQPKQSCCPEDTMVTTLNAPWWGIRGEFNQNPFGSTLLQIVLKAGGLDKPEAQASLALETRPAHELLWGFNSPILELFNSTLSSLGEGGIETFFPGYMGPNQTSPAEGRLDGRYTSFVGARNASMASFMTQWKGMTTQTVTIPGSTTESLAWGSPNASQVQGHDPDSFGQNLQPCGTVRVFVSSLHRWIDIHNVDCQHVEVKGIDMLHYRLPESVLQTANVNPDNGQWFSLGHHGMFNLTRVSSFAPAFVSKPHFLDTDQQLISAGQAMGLSPASDAHDSYLNAEPRTGLNMDFHARLMTSLLIGSCNVTSMGSTMPVLPNLYAGYVPVFWIDQHALIPDDDAQTFRDGIYFAHHLVDTLRWIGPVIAAALIALGVVLLVGRSHRHPLIAPRSAPAYTPLPAPGA